MVDQRKDEDATVRSGDPVEAAEVEPEESGRVQGRTQKEIIWRRFKRHKLAMVCGAVLILLYFVALVTPWIAPYGFAEQDFTAMNQGPSFKHPMGTDQLGRDELTRVLYGGRVSMMIGLGVWFTNYLHWNRRGYCLRLLRPICRQRVDGDRGLRVSSPVYPGVAGAGKYISARGLQHNVRNSPLALAEDGRLVRGQVLALRDQEYVQAAKAVGVSDFRIMLRHIFPNTFGIVVVEATLIVALAIILESIISFLGFGIQPPTPSWGNMLTDARSQMTTQWWLTIFPGLMIVITALCVNFVGDGLRDALDPKAVE